MNRVGDFDVPLRIRKRYKDVVPLAYLVVATRNPFATNTISNPERSQEWHTMGFILIFKPSKRNRYQAWVKGGLLPLAVGGLMSSPLFETNRSTLSAAKKRMGELRKLKAKYHGKWRFEYCGPFTESSWPVDFKRQMLLEEV